MSVFREKKTARSLLEDLSALSCRIDQLESRAKIAKLEAAEIYDKTLRLMQRMAKRYEVDKKEELNGPDPEIPAGDETTVDPISARILRRRNAGGFQR